MSLVGLRIQQSAVETSQVLTLSTLPISCLEIPVLVGLQLVFWPLSHYAQRFDTKLALWPHFFMQIVVFWSDILLVRVFDGVVGRHPSFGRWSLKESVF